MKKKLDLKQQYEFAKKLNETRRKRDYVPFDFDIYDKQVETFLKLIRESGTTVGSSGGLDSEHLSGQTRVGPKDGIITRLNPSAARPQDVKETDDYFIQAINLISNTDPDLFTDEQEVEIHELLKDIIYFSDNIDEAGFRNRMSGSKKVALRKYARNNKQKILTRLKNREHTVKQIVKDKKRKKMEKYQQTASGKRMKKNHVSGGDHRRTK